MTTVYVELGSGFGNQIFQYALALTAQTDFGFKTYILPSKGNTHSQKNYQNLFRLVPHSTESEIPFIVAIVNKKKEAFQWWDIKTLGFFRTVKLSGYYQNYQLYRTVVPKLVTELCDTFQTMYGSPTWNANEYAFIHVRRTDYFFKHIKMYNLQMNYYNEAIQALEAQSPHIKFIVLSDDDAWCKAQKWPTTHPVEFFESDDELKAFWCFLNCKAGAIIANSTFSYWGALLSAHQHNSPIIYPNAWHIEEEVDIFPERWLGIGSKGTSLKLPS